MTTIESGSRIQGVGAFVSLLGPIRTHAEAKPIFMMDAFSVTLEARDPQLGRFRAYHLEAGTDLLGDWLVDITFGRIGTPGRRIRYAVSNESEARKLVRESLRAKSVRQEAHRRAISVP